MKIIEPTLLLATKKCRKNIALMVAKANKNNLILRPHFKTHQSRTIGRFFRAFGIDKITVSSLKQAIYFAEDGWKDITVAFPVNLLEIDRINFLAKKIKLNLLVESPKISNRLDKLLKAPVKIFIKIDVGYHRTGIEPNNSVVIDTILETIKSSSKLHFAGFLCHAGHSYDVKNIQEIKGIHYDSMAILKNLKDRYQSVFPGLINSIGDTPTCSVMDNFENIDEIRPGTFVFYDLAQWRIGACTLDQIAIAMACPAVAKHPDRKEIVVYGGAVHFSKDFSYLPSGEQYYGFVVDLYDDGWRIPDGLDYLTSISQEHGVVKFNSNRFKRINEGDIIIILPIHSCLAGNLMKKYFTRENEIITRL